MDIPSSCKSVLHVVNSGKDSRLPVNLKEKRLIDDLEGSFREILRVHDIQERECKSKETCIDDGFEQPKPRAFDKCLTKCKTFPSGVTLLPDNKVESETGSRHPSEITLQQPLVRSISLPLAYAMKGSRELRGGTPMKLTVKWAPDVYDPPQTLLSHTVKNKKQIQHKSKNKKNGRKWQKSNSVRGSSGKDKKQVRRDKSVSTHGRFVDTYGEIVDFVGSPDPYCGSNFLINSVTKVHYSVAEAL